MVMARGPDFPELDRRLDEAESELSAQQARLSAADRGFLRLHAGLGGLVRGYLKLLVGRWDLSREAAAALELLQGRVTRLARRRRRLWAALLSSLSSALGAGDNVES